MEKIKVPQLQILEETPSFVSVSDPQKPLHQQQEFVQRQSTCLEKVRQKLRTVRYCFLAVLLLLLACAVVLSFNLEGQIILKPIETVNYTITQQYKLEFGQSVYVVGSIPQLGSWDPSKAIKMNSLQDKYWLLELQIPIQQSISYKFFIAASQTELFDVNRISWIDLQSRRLRIDHEISSNFLKQNDECLKIMSFNIRFENIRDTGKRSWQERKNHVATLILKNLPDLIGVQQPRKNQRQYLHGAISDFYLYYGKPRDLNQDQQSGIFVRRDKFIVRQDGYVWINENRTQGIKGYGSRLPRYFTYLVLSPLAQIRRLILIINTHLDHESPNSRLNGIKLISTVIKQLNHKYDQKINNVFVTGDFNTDENDTIFDDLMHNNKQMQSMRLILPKQQSDFGQTYNGYSVPTSVERTTQIQESGSKTKIYKIDHIFMSSEDYQPTRFELIRTTEHIVSDHYPIIGTLMLGN